MDLLELEKKIVPEIFDLLETRYNLLRSIYYNQPIGRRSLAQELNIGERTVRTEVNILKNQGLLNIESMGMYITEEGKKIVEELKDIIYQLKDISKLEERLETILNIEKIIIVPGNLDENKLILKDIGKASSIYLKELVKNDYILGITGGSTMAEIAEEMIPGKTAKNILVTPARGGLGKDVESQSNSIAAQLAKKLDGDYKLLHIPDNINKATRDAVLKIPDVKEVVELIQKINILVFGIGRADVMAKRRQLNEGKIEKLIENGAVSEAFGHYFDIKGDDIWESLTVGLSLNGFQKIEKVIGVAGGADKAEAIMSIASLRENMTLITDEGAAKRIIKIVEKATM